MSYIPSVSVAEQAGAIAPPPDIDHACVVFGPTSAGTTNTLNGLYASAAATSAALGYGDTIDASSYITDPINPQRQPPGQVMIYKSAASTAGTTGTNDTSGITGSASAHAALAGASYITGDIQVKAIGAITVGTSGNFQWSADNGINWSSTIPLGTATTYPLPGTNVTWTAGQAADVWNDGDIIKAHVTAPACTGADIDAAASILAQSPYDFSEILFVAPMSASIAAHVTTLLNTLLAAGKRVKATIVSRGANSGESESTWFASVAADFLAFNDDRIEFKEGYRLLMRDPVTSRQYLRTWVPAYFARMLSQSRRTWAGSPDDGGLDGVQLYTAAGALVGHDEGPSGNITGLSDIGQGNRFGCVFRGATPQTRLAVYTTPPWVAFNEATIGSDPVFLSMVRRVCFNAERAAMAVSFSDLGGSVFTDIDPTTGIVTLQPDSQDAIHGTLFDALTIATKGDVENSGDADPVTGLVAVSSVVTKAQQLVTVPITLNLSIGGWIIKIALTVTVQ